MRDPKRINKTLKVIRKIWKKNPDLRLMQLLINAVGYEEGTYYTRDNALLAQLVMTYRRDL